MALLMDTSVWSHAYRRDQASDLLEVGALKNALVGGEDVFTTGMILLELLRGFVPDRAQELIRTEFGFLSFLEPTKDDYVAAARLANLCKRGGVQLGSVDALIAQLAIANDLTLLTADRDFEHAQRHIPLRLWSQA